MTQDKVLNGEAKKAILDQGGILMIKGNICAPRVDDLNRLIMEVAHNYKNSIHPASGSCKNV